VADAQVPQSPPTPKPKRNVSPEIIGAAFLAVVLLIFVVQNDARVDVTWLVFGVDHQQLWVVILVSAVLGYLVGQLIEFGLKRRRRERARGRD
jgi:uncharacterized integral membrane protein